MTWRFIRIQNEEIWLSGELNTLVQCMFHTRSQRALSRRKFWRAYGQTHKAIAVAELNKKQKRFYWWNVKTIKDCENIWFMCVFPSYLQVINKLYEKCSTDWHIIYYRNYKIYFLNYSVIKWEKGVRSSLYKPIIKLSLGKHWTKIL